MTGSSLPPRGEGKGRHGRGCASSSGSPAPASAAASALEDALRWDTRIHDERNAALAYVCESPVILEQRAFALAREIQTHLD